MGSSAAGGKTDPESSAPARLAKSTIFASAVMSGERAWMAVATIIRSKGSPCIAWNDAGLNGGHAHRLHATTLTGGQGDEGKDGVQRSDRGVISTMPSPEGTSNPAAR
jgi:hypothetical protein